MSNQPNDRKISNFLAGTTLPSGSYLTFISGGTNYKILASDFLAALGVTGTIVQDGDPLGVPVLDKSGSINNIRNVEPGSGISASVSAQNGLTIEHNFSEDTTGVELITDLTAASPKFRSLVAGSGINIAGSGDEIQISLSSTPVSTKTVIVNSISDFPAAVSGVITLADDTEYAIRNDITTSSRFVFGNNTVISGSDSRMINLTYTGSGNMFTAASKSLTINSITMTCTGGTFLVFTGTGAEILQIERSVIIADTLGSISNFAGIHFDDTQQIVTTDGFTFGGTNGVILLEANLSTIEAGTMYDLSTATFTGFSVTDAFVTLNGSSVFLGGAASSANITSGNIGSIHNSRFFGTGTPLNTIAAGDTRWEFALNNGLSDSSRDVLMSMVGNASDTVIATVSTPVKVTGTWTEEDAFSFTTDSTGKMTYSGEKDVELNVSFSFTVAPASGTNKNVAMYVAKNGSVITNSGAPVTLVSSTNSQRVSVNWRLSLSNGDYVEAYTENRTDSVDILVSDGVMRIS